VKYPPLKFKKGRPSLFIVIAVPSAELVFLAFPDLSDHLVIVVPLAGTLPVAKGSLESYQFCTLLTIGSIGRAVTE
jgi:hypothetical protein